MPTRRWDTRQMPEMVDAGQEKNAISNASGNDNVTIVKLIRVISKHIITIIVTFVITVAAICAWTATMPKKYTADVQLFASYSGTSGSSNAAEQFSGGSYIMNQIQSYPSLVSTSVVLQPVIDELHLQTSVGQLASEITASNPSNTAVINISVADTDVDQVAQIANSVASSLSNVVEKSLYTTGNTSSIKLTVVQPAQIPGAPSSPSWRMNVLIGILGGLFLGLIIALLKDVLSKNIEDENEIEEYIDAPIVGRIPEADILKSSSPVVISEPGSPIAEDYRRIRTNLSFIAPAGTSDCRLIVVTSTGASEGKTTSSVNIATALAENGARVLLIDADLRHPSVANKLDLDEAAGLTHVLSGQASIKDVLQRYWKANLHILPAGPKPPNASALLNSPVMAELLNNAMQQYDYVLVDTAPMIVANDAVIFLRRGGSLIMVCRRDQTRKHDLREIAEELETLDMNVSGVVFNCAKENKKALENSNYYYYTNGIDKKRQIEISEF